MVESQLRQRGIRDERLLAAMSKVPRHEFVSQQNWNEAYADHPDSDCRKTDNLAALHDCRHGAGGADQA